MMSSYRAILSIVCLLAIASSVVAQSRGGGLFGRRSSGDNSYSRRGLFNGPNTQNQQSARNRRSANDARSNSSARRRSTNAAQGNRYSNQGYRRSGQSGYSDGRSSRDYRGQYSASRGRESEYSAAASGSDSDGVVPNELPPKKVVKAQRNADPELPPLEPIHADTLALARNVVMETAGETLLQLTKDLGPAANNPQIQQRIELIGTAINNKEILSDADLQHLANAIVATDELKDDSGQIPPATQDQLNESMDKLIGLSKALHVLDAPLPSDGVQPGRPTGTIYAVSCPPLGEGQMLALPGGDVLYGTGGIGSFDAITTSASDLFGIQMGIGKPLRAGLLSPQDTLTSGVLVLNPANSAAAVNFVYSGRRHTLEPGDEQYFDEADEIVRFDRGSGRGQARYKLTDGTFVFTATDSGWELFKQPFELTIDNSANHTSFNYVVNNKQHQVPAGRTASHESDYPLLVRFDRGHGGEAKKDIVMPDAKLVVAVDPNDGLWDLFAADNFPEYDGGDALAHMNSSAQAALSRERDRLASASRRERFSVMKPIIGRLKQTESKSEETNLSWEVLRERLDADVSSAPAPLRNDDISESLPQPLGDE